MKLHCPCISLNRNIMLWIMSSCFVEKPTSWCPLKAAWCRLVRPARSETLTLVSRGMRYSAHLTALLAAATWSGVCQYLSRAFTSALCLKRASTVSCKGSMDLTKGWMRKEGGATHVALGAACSVQRGQPFVVLGVHPCPVHQEQICNLCLAAVSCCM